MRTLFLLLVFIVAGGVALAQLFSGGIKAGVPLTDAFQRETFTTVSTNVTANSFSDSKRFVAGGMIELHLPFGFSIEADGLYHPLPLTTVTTEVGATFIGQESTSYTSWEVPVVGKYRFLHTPLIKPYIEAGPSFRFFDTTLISQNLSSHGFVLGGGVELKIPFLTISPELRYLLWGADATRPVTFTAESAQNQVEFLVGVSFGK